METLADEIAATDIAVRHIVAMLEARHPGFAAELIDRLRDPDRTPGRRRDDALAEALDGLAGTLEEGGS